MIFFLFFPENRIWHFMQIVSIGDNLHWMSKTVFWEKQEKYFSIRLLKTLVRVLLALEVSFMCILDWGIYCRLGLHSHHMTHGALILVWPCKKCPTKHPSAINWLIVLGFNDMSTLVGHFVSSPREREKSDRRDSRRDEREGQGRKRNRNESEETGEIKTFPLDPYLLQG